MFDFTPTEVPVTKCECCGRIINGDMKQLKVHNKNGTNYNSGILCSNCFDFANWLLKRTIYAVKEEYEEEGKNV